MSRWSPLAFMSTLRFGGLLAVGACTVTMLGCVRPKPAFKPPPPPLPKTATTTTADERYRAVPEPGPRPQFAPPSASKIQMENGLAIWHMKQGDTPLVAVHLMLQVGSASDPIGKEGLTLLTADLLDEGAGKFSALELSDALGELATDYSSSGGIDYVLLSMSALAENLEPSLALLADIVRKPRLDKAEFERRRDHHVATALTSHDDPRDARSRALASALFGVGYGGRASNGTVDSLKRITHLDVKRHASKLAIPQGAHLILAGGVELREGQRLVEQYFGTWTGKSTAVDAKLLDEPEGRTAYVVDFPEAAQSSLVVARRAGNDSDPNYFSEEVVNDRLGGSFTGRINMNLREDKGYTYGAQSIFRRYHHAGYFGVFSDVISDATAASVKEIFGELEALCKNRPLSEQERDEAVEGMLLGFVMDFAETESVGLRLASLPLRDRPVDFWSTWSDQVGQVTTQRANEAAQPYCDVAQFSVVIAGDRAKMAPGLESLGLRVVEMNRDGMPLTPPLAPPQ